MSSLRFMAALSPDSMGTTGLASAPSEAQRQYWPRAFERFASQDSSTIGTGEAVGLQNIIHNRGSNLMIRASMEISDCGGNFLRLGLIPNLIQLQEAIY